MIEFTVARTPTTGSNVYPVTCNTLQEAVKFFSCVGVDGVVEVDSRKIEEKLQLSRMDAYYFVLYDKQIRDTDVNGFHNRPYNLGGGAHVSQALREAWMAENQGQMGRRITPLPILIP